MDMTIAPVLDDFDRQRLSQAAGHLGCVNVAVVHAALDIDAGLFADAQLKLLDALNGHASHGGTIPDASADLVATVRANLAGHRYQTCALRSCLDLVEALRLGCKPTSLGERIGRILQATAVLADAQWRSQPRRRAA